MLSFKAVLTYIFDINSFLLPILALFSYTKMNPINTYTFCPKCGVDTSIYAHEDNCPLEKSNSQILLVIMSLHFNNLI